MMLSMALPFFYVIKLKWKGLADDEKKPKRQVPPLPSIQIERRAQLPHETLESVWESYGWGEVNIN